MQRAASRSSVKVALNIGFSESGTMSFLGCFMGGFSSSHYRVSPNTSLPNTRSHNTRLLCGCRILRPLVFNTRFQEYKVFLPPSCFSFAPPGGGARRHSTVLKAYSADFIEGAGRRGPQIKSFLIDSVNK